MIKPSFLLVILVCVLSTPVYCSETPSGPKSPTQPNVVSPLSTPITKPFSSPLHKEDPKSLVPKTPDILPPRPFLDQLIEQKRFQDFLRSEEDLTPQKVLQYILRLFKEKVSNVTERLNEANPEEYIMASDLKGLTKGLGMFSSSLRTLLTNLVPGIVQYKDLKASWEIWKTKVFQNLASQLSRLTLNEPKRALERELKQEEQSPISRKVWAFFQIPKNYQALWVWLSKGDGLALAKTCKGLRICFSYIKDKVISLDSTDYRKIESELKSFIPYLFRRDYIDGQDEKTLHDTMEHLINGLSSNYLPMLVKDDSTDELISLKDEMNHIIWGPAYYKLQDTSIWMHNILIDMFHGREFITPSEYNSILRCIPNELRRQIYTYFKYVKEGHISDSSYKYTYAIKEGVIPSVPRTDEYYKDINLQPELLFALENTLRVSPLSQCIKHPPSKDLVKLIYIAATFRSLMNFVIFDFLNLAKLDILLTCNASVGSFPLSPDQRHRVQVLQPRKLAVNFGDRVLSNFRNGVQPEFRSVYEEIFFFYVEKLIIYQRTRYDDGDSTGCLSYVMIYLTLNSYERELKKAFQDTLKIVKERDV